MMIMKLYYSFGESFDNVRCLQVVGCDFLFVAGTNALVVSMVVDCPQTCQRSDQESEACCSQEGPRRQEEGIRLLPVSASDSDFKFSFASK